MDTQYLIEQIGEMTKKILCDYRERIERAYLKADGDLTIKMSHKLSGGDASKIKVVTSIAFVEDQVKDDTTYIVDPNQFDLFPHTGEGDVPEAAPVAPKERQIELKAPAGALVET